MARRAAVGLAPKALDSIPSLGQRPRLSRSRRLALKARFTFSGVQTPNESRLQRSIRGESNSRGRCPAKGDIAPSALNRHSAPSLPLCVAFQLLRKLGWNVGDDHGIAALIPQFKHVADTMDLGD